MMFVTTKQQPQYKHLFVLVITSILSMCCIGKPLQNWVRKQNTQSDTDMYTYALMIDAGSSGSRISAYRWKRRDFSTIPVPLSIPLEVEQFHESVSPGINLPSGRQKLENLLMFAREHFAAKGLGHRIHEFPLYLKATAGMRILSADARDTIMDQVQHTLAQSGFQFEPNQARVIAGEEEGVFGWLTVNFLNNNIPKQSNISFIGALDLGGASTQITFQPFNGDILANLYNIQLEKQLNENVYTHSFLYFGQNEALYRSNRIVYEQLDKKTPLLHPCFLNGLAVQTISSSERPLDTVLGIGQVDINGLSNFTQCRQIVQQLIPQTVQCFTNPVSSMYTTSMTLSDTMKQDKEENITCSINGVYQPRIQENKKFIGFSGFTYVWDFYKLSPTASLDELIQAVEEFCTLDWTMAKQKYPSEPLDYLATYCFTGNYIYSLLVDGYGFDPTSHSQLTVATNGALYSYSLGSMLYEANARAYRYHHATMTHRTEIIALSIFLGIFVLATIILATILVRLRKRTESEYSAYIDH